ncbi:MAG: glycerol-3-phosphate acyltransferase [Nitrospinaceae bacterium]|nr:MAG: glycerol-3-phosphate acyltransferase [Nitrospinaceae bacterium]
MTPFLVWAVSYLLGSIPFGILFARKSNVDIRNHGSGNIGATNVARVLGKKAGLLTLAGDVFKGLAAVAIASRFLDHPWEIAVAGLMAFIGHVYSVFLKFKGGKGVATGLGIFLYLMPLATVSSMAVFGVSLWASGYVSVGSILAALSIPLFGIYYQIPPEFIAVSVIVALIVVSKHQGNLERILAGTEARFLKKIEFDKTRPENIMAEQERSE